MEHRLHGGARIVARLLEDAARRLLGGGVLGAGTRLLAALNALRPRLLAVDAAVATVSNGGDVRRLRDEWSAFRTALTAVESAAGEVRRALKL